MFALVIASFVTDAGGFVGTLSAATLVAGAFAVIRATRELTHRGILIRARFASNIARGTHISPEHLLILEHLELSGREASIAELTTEMRISPSRARAVLYEMIEYGIVDQESEDIFTVTSVGRNILRSWHLAAADAGSPVDVTDFVSTETEKRTRGESRSRLSEEELDLAIDRELSRAAGPA